MHVLLPPSPSDNVAPTCLLVHSSIFSKFVYMEGWRRMFQMLASLFELHQLFTATNVQGFKSSHLIEIQLEDLLLFTS